jgi:D-xylose 1-dehydrogenase (NADP+, D-xylono-1,5-lactone-forming)
MGFGKFRWGILGNAEIASRAVIPGIQHSETGELAAIASRGDGVKTTAERFGIPKTYSSYENLLEDKSIDAVYIPLPNHLHKEWTIRAAESKKHVLCEKPIALNAKEAEAMAEACQKAGVQLAEAFMYRHHPRYQIIKEIIRSGEIGAIRGLHGTFTYNGSSNPNNIRFHRNMGGGSIYDVGCYPISAARYILEQEPEAVTVHGFLSEQHDGVDMMASGLIEFAGGISMTFDCGMWAKHRNTLEILGTEGSIEIPVAFMAKADGSANFIVNGQEREAPLADQYAVQVDDFARSVWGEMPQRFTPSDAVSNMRVIDACLKSLTDRNRVIIQ